VSQKEPFEVDLADPASLRQRLAELDDIVKEKERLARAAAKELSHWREMRKRLQALVSAAAPQPKGAVTSWVVQAQQRFAEGKSIQAQVESLVDAAPGPVTANDILARIPDAKRETVNWALWHAEDQGRIQRIQQGVYASLDYGEKTPQLLPGETDD